MKVIDWFDRNPRSLHAWLWRLKLKPGEVVEVGGQLYRYSQENKGQDHVLTLVDAPGKQVTSFNAA